MWKDGSKMRRFLVIDVLQLILVEPDTKRLGWGVAKLVGFLQDIEVSGDKDDSRCLHITIHRPLSGTSTNRIPLLSAKFIFDDNIRCMAAKQRLSKGRIKARQKKMQHIARLLEIPGQSGPPSPAFVGSGVYNSRLPNRFGGGGVLIRNGEHQRLQSTIPLRGPGLATPRRDSSPTINNRLVNKKENRSRDSSTNRLMNKSSREGSPRMPRPRSEEIPLELIKKTTTNPLIDMAPKLTILSRPQTPKTDTVGNEVVASTSTNNGDNNSINDGTNLVINDGEMNKGIVNKDISEETSFIADDDDNSNSNKKGIVQTV